jgi:hypothetical protein
MGHFGSGDWNNPTGTIFREKITEVGPTSGQWTKQTITGSSLTIPRTGFYQAYIMLLPTANNAGNANTTATMQGGVNYTDRHGARQRDLTDAHAWKTASGGTAMVSTTAGALGDSSAPVFATEGSTLSFYVTTLNNSGSNQNLTAYLMVRAI